MDLRSSQSDINSQNSPAGVTTIPSHWDAIPNGNTTTSARRYPSAASPPYHNNSSNNDGQNSASCSYNNYSGYDKKQISSLLSAVGTLHLVVTELKADQDASRNEFESTIRALSKQAKESEDTIALLRSRLERLEMTVDVRQPPSWTARASENRDRPEACNLQHNEEEKDESDVDGRNFAQRRLSLLQLKEEKRLVRTPNPKRINSRGVETSATAWESESDSDHQQPDVTRNECREGNSSEASLSTPQVQADPVTTSGFDGRDPGGNARSLITDATTMMHSEAGNMVETIDDDESDNLRDQFIHRNSSLLCMVNPNDYAMRDPILYCDGGNPVPPQAVPAEIEIKPGTSHHDLGSEESSIGAVAARMPNRDEDSVSLISDISFFNHNHNPTANNRNDNNSSWTDVDVTQKLEDLKRAIEETRMVSQGGHNRFYSNN